MLLMLDHPAQPQLVVAAAIVNDPDNPTRLLTAVRAYPEELAGQVELPGGKVEPGEDPIAALHREIHEELGAELELIEEVVAPEELALMHEGLPAWPLTDRFVMRVWLAGLSPYSRQPECGPDHRRISMTPLGELTDLPWLPADVVIAERILQLLRERR